MTLTVPFVPTYDVLGCAIHGVTAEKLTDLVDRAVDDRQFSIVANHNLHSLYWYHKDPKMQQFFRHSRWTHADGMSVVLLGRLLGARLDRSARVTYVDWLPLLMERARERSWRVFYLGSRPGIADEGARKLIETYSGIDLEYAHGHFDSAGEENQKILERIGSYSPHILFVGMGMPRQEHWILDNLEHLGTAVVLPCGAAIDYVAGEIRTPPRWAGRWGLEWLFRLIAEPGRLWRRYLIEPWLLSALLARRWFQPQSTRKNTRL